MEQGLPGKQLPNTIVVVGKRAASARPWLRRVALLALAASSLTAGSAMAHGDHEHDNRYDPISRTAPATNKAALADNSLLSSAVSGRLSWASADTGRVDGQALIASWEASGLTPAQGMELISVLFHSQSPVIARTEEALDMAKTASQSTASLLEIKTADQASAFLRARSIDSLVDSGILAELVGINVADSFNTSSWQDVSDYWDNLHVQTLGEAPVEQTPSSPREVKQALAALTSAVDKVGLAGLQIPLGMWGDAEQMNTLAQKLSEANNTLSQLSGLSGQVLGVNGRVFYTPTSPMENAFAYKASSSMVMISALWADVPHEWLHVMDMSQRTSRSANNAVGGASLSHEVGSSRTSPLAQAWGSLVDKFTDQSDPVVQAWTTSRSEYTSRSEDAALYLNSSFEVVAYVWGSYVQSQQKPGDVFYDATRNERLAYNGAGPNLQQAQAFASSWKAAFASVDEHWWSGQAMSTDTITPVVKTKINIESDLWGDSSQTLANISPPVPRR